MTHIDGASDEHHNAARNGWLEVFRPQVDLADSKRHRGELVHDVLRALELLPLECEHRSFLVQRA